MVNTAEGEQASGWCSGLRALHLLAPPPPTVRGGQQMTVSDARLSRQP